MHDIKQKALILKQLIIGSLWLVIRMWEKRTVWIAYRKVVTVSNYPGTTVEVFRGMYVGSNNTVEVIDTPESTV